MGPFGNDHRLDDLEFTLDASEGLEAMLLLHASVPSYKLSEVTIYRLPVCRQVGFLSGGQKLVMKRRAGNGLSAGSRRA